MTDSPAPPPVRFGAFEFSCHSLQLTKYGLRIKLQEMPSRILRLLLERPGELVTRETLRNELWPNDAYGEFDAGLNTAVSKLRTALGDSTATPMFIERVPKLGYRFIAPLQRAEAAPVVTAIPAVPTKSAPQGRRFLLLGGIAALLVLFAGWRIAVYEWPAGAPAISRFTINLPADQTLAIDNGRAVAISADGHTLAYLAFRGGVRQIFAKRMEDVEFQALPASIGAEDLFLSPDGNSVGFRSGWMLFATDLAGRDPRQLTSDLPAVRNGLWGADGSLFLAGRPPASTSPPSSAYVVYRAQAGQTEPAIVTGPRPKPLGWYFPQQLLPGANELLVSSIAGPKDRVVALRSLRDGTERVVADPGMGGYYLPTGHLVYAWRGSLRATPLRPSEGRPSRPAAEVAQGIAGNGWAGLQAAISQTGTLAYIPAISENRTLVWVDRDGRETPLPLPPAPYDLLALSPDGSHILLSRAEGTVSSIWDYDMTLGTWTRVASGDWQSTSGSWSPDGSTIVFSATLQGEQYENLYIKRLGSDAPPERLAPSPHGQFAQSWSAREGLVFTESDRPGTHIDLFLIAPKGERKPGPLVGTAYDDSHGAFSPDGRWLAYLSDYPQGHEVYIEAWPGGSPIRVSPAGGEAPLWSPRGGELFYRTRDAVWSVGVRGGKPEAPKRLFNDTYSAASIWNRRFLVAKDGRFLMMKNRPEPEARRRIVVVVNWARELEQLVRGTP